MEQNQQNLLIVCYGRLSFRWYYYLLRKEIQEEDKFEREDEDCTNILSLIGIRLVTNKLELPAPVIFDKKDLCDLQLLSCVFSFKIDGTLQIDKPNCLTADEFKCQILLNRLSIVLQADLVAFTTLFALCSVHISYCKLNQVVLSIHMSLSAK